ncbi:hypothetical protein LQF12_12315 [Ruania suaedae]|uniref:putative acetyltransferase n=1 Tax=Ruania suaedae TaxID=2897774 RepID=UPI001E5A9BE4|nr:hypothetical protein [Ruania suaedae]UFU02285.1 hypothetical protein LQF12_12315 [Ruania suaedae]
MPERPPEPGGWRSWRPGERVVVRFRLPEGGLTDALGEVVRVGPGGLAIRTRRGVVDVPAEAVMLAKRVPPPPPRRR